MIGLRDRDLRNEGLFVAEGRLLVERAIASSCAVIGLCTDAAAAEDARLLCADTIPLTICSSEELDRIAGFPFHRGMFALAERPSIPLTSTLIPSLSAHPALYAQPLSIRKILVLPAITDPGNLGALFRSASAFSYDLVCLGEQSCDPFNRKVLRASMGAILSMPICTAHPEDLGLISGYGIPILAAAMEEQAVIAGNYSVSGDSHALVLGNEYEGIPAKWRERCSLAISIPVSPDVDSLNVAIAGSILMWELSRQAFPLPSTEVLRP